MNRDGLVGRSQGWGAAVAGRDRRPGQAVGTATEADREAGVQGGAGYRAGLGDHLEVAGDVPERRIQGLGGWGPRPGATAGQVRRVQEEHVPGVTSSCSVYQWFYSGGPTRPWSARVASDVGGQVQGRDGGSRRTPNSQLLLELADQTGNRFFRTALRRLSRPNPDTPKLLLGD